MRPRPKKGPTRTEIRHDAALQSLMFAALAMDARPTSKQLMELLECARFYRLAARRLSRLTRKRG